MTEILDFVVIFLLIIAIIYGFILNRRILLIQNSKKELANLFKSFDNTILKAQTSIDDMKKVSSEISGGLQQKIDKAAIIIDDLEFLSEKAVEITVKMENKIVPIKKSLEAAKADSEKDSLYNPAYIQNIKQNDSFARSPKISPTAMAADTKKARALENLLEKISKTNSEKEKYDAKPGLFKKFAAKPPKANNNELVEDVLKALGYGE